MAREIPLVAQSTSALGEFGRPMALGGTTGPRDLARRLGAPSLVLTDRTAAEVSAVTESGE